MTKDLVLWTAFAMLASGIFFCVHLLVTGFTVIEGRMTGDLVPTGQCYAVQGADWAG